MRCACIGGYRRGERRESRGDEGWRKTALRAYPPHIKDFDASVGVDIKFRRRESRSSGCGVCPRAGQQAVEQLAHAADLGAERQRFGTAEEQAAVDIAALRGGEL